MLCEYRSRLLLSVSSPVRQSNAVCHSSLYNMNSAESFLVWREEMLQGADRKWANPTAVFSCQNFKYDIWLPCRVSNEEGKGAEGRIVCTCNCAGSNMRHFGLATCMIVSPKHVRYQMKMLLDKKSSVLAHSSLLSVCHSAY